MNDNWHKYPTYLEGRRMKMEPEKEVQYGPHDYRRNNLDIKVLGSLALAFALIYGCSYIGDKIHKNGIADKQRQSMTNSLERIGR